jgi:hypothetical protein
VSWETDSFQLGQLCLLHRRQVVLFEDLVVGSQGRNEIQQPALVGHVRLIDTSEDEILVSTDLVKLPQQHFDCGRARTRQHLDLSILGAICFAMQNVPHVLLRDHVRLVFWEVVPIALKSFIQISSVLHNLRELIDRELDIGVCLHM